MNKDRPRRDKSKPSKVQKSRKLIRRLKAMPRNHTEATQIFDEINHRWHMGRDSVVNSYMSTRPPFPRHTVSAQWRPQCTHRWKGCPCDLPNTTPPS